LVELSVKPADPTISVTWGGGSTIAEYFPAGAARLCNFDDENGKKTFFDGALGIQKWQQSKDNILGKQVDDSVRPGGMHQCNNYDCASEIQELQQKERYIFVVADGCAACAAACHRGVLGLIPGPGRTYN
jgi:hypothetical protein